MRPDIWLGILTIFMAVLGGIVSIHAPSKLWLKIAYVIAFVLAGAASVFLIIRISNENATSNQKLNDTLTSLNTSTGEIARMTQLNTQLQEKLLKSGDTILNLSRETKYQVTGEKGYCYLLPVINPVNGDAGGLPLLVVNPTKYPVIGVIADIMQQIRPGDSSDVLAQKLQNTISLSLGDVSNTFARGTGYRLPVRRDRDNKFQINIFSRGRQQNEFLVVTWNNGMWNVDYELPGRNKKIRSDFPYIEKDH